jgi:hypothetical protein
VQRAPPSEAATTYIGPVATDRSERTVWLRASTRRHLGQWSPGIDVSIQLLTTVVSDEMGRLSPSDRLAPLRALRSVSLLAILTVGALYSIDGDVSRPHGNPLLYAIAMSWLISITVALPTSAIFRVHSKLLPLARWENDGEVYDRRSIRAFRWLLLQSPLGWINGNLQLRSRHDWDRLLTEMIGSEAVHWITGSLATILGISYLVGGHGVYGYVMLLVRIPFDLYPVMLLRRNRGRVYCLLRRQQRTSG